MKKSSPYEPIKERVTDKRKEKRRIGIASHGCISIVIVGQHQRCLWCSLFVPKSS